MTQLGNGGVIGGRVRAWNESVAEVKTWLMSPKIERASGSAFHRFSDALIRGDVLYPPNWPQSDALNYYEKHFAHEFQIFVVEHDWASAFKNAEISGELDPKSDDYRIPFPACCFEFQISGHRALYCIREPADAEVEFSGYRHIVTCVVETRSGWTSFLLSQFNHGELADLLKNESRAACIALDAGVAVSIGVQPPAKLNAARRKRGRAPLRDYHVINLARQREPSVHNTPTAERVGVRLHFRRGHWRHYPSHKIWIKWTLVGNPDLGFIEKHYRL